MEAVPYYETDRTVEGSQDASVMWQRKAQEVEHFQCKLWFENRVQCEFDAWCIFVYGRNLENVPEFSEQNGVVINLSDLLKFIGFQYARGWYGKHH